MKNLLLTGLTLWFFLFLMPGVALSQKAPAKNASTIATEVTKAIRAGNAQEMAKYFGQNVDLHLPGSEGIFSRSQAEIIFRNFFSKNPSLSFSVDQQGASRDGSIYVIGTLKTKKGNTFRVYFYVKKVSETFFLHQVQFELQ